MTKSDSSLNYCPIDKDSKCIQDQCGWWDQDKKTCSIIASAIACTFVALYNALNKSKLDQLGNKDKIEGGETVS